jgi:hypothetical protein
MGMLVFHVKSFSGTKKDCVEGREFHEYIEVKTAYRHWIKRYLIDNKSYQEKYDYLIKDKKCFISVLVAQQLSRRAVTLPRVGDDESWSVKVADHLNTILRSSHVICKKTYSCAMQEFNILVRAHKEILKYDDVTARKKAIKSMKNHGIDIKAFFPEVVSHVNADKIEFTIPKMAKILGLKPKQVITVLIDMGLLVYAGKSTPRITMRGLVYSDKESLGIHKFNFYPETLIMVEVKHELERASFWDFIGKKPRNLPENWLKQSKSMQFLANNSIALPF